MPSLSAPSPQELKHSIPRTCRGRGCAGGRRRPGTLPRIPGRARAWASPCLGRCACPAGRRCCSPRSRRSSLSPPPCAARPPPPPSRPVRMCPHMSAARFWEIPLPSPSQPALIRLLITKSMHGTARLHLPFQTSALWMPALACRHITTHLRAGGLDADCTARTGSAQLAKFFNLQ